MMKERGSLWAVFQREEDIQGRNAIHWWIFEPISKYLKRLGRKSAWKDTKSQEVKCQSAITVIMGQADDVQ